MKKTFLAICAVALGLLTMSSCGKLEDSIDGLQNDLDALTQRVDQLEKDLNADVKSLEDLIAAVSVRLAPVYAGISRHTPPEHMNPAL